MNTRLRSALAGGATLAALVLSVAASGSSYAATPTVNFMSGSDPATATAGHPGPDALSQLTAMGAHSDVLAQFADFAVAPAHSTLIQTLCVGPKRADGGQAVLYGCDDTYKVGSCGGTLYLEDKFWASVESHGDPVVEVRFGPGYGAGNLIHDWRPGSEQPYGQCTTVTSSLMYQGTGISISQQACPEKWGLLDVGRQHFTTHWYDRYGTSNNRDTTGVDAVIDGPTGWPYPGVNWYFAWIDP